MAARHLLEDAALAPTACTTIEEVGSTGVGALTITFLILSVATIIFKSIMCLMTRNALVISPHPVALGCCTAVTLELQTAIEKAGGPAHALQILTRPTVEAVRAPVLSR